MLDSPSEIPPSPSSAPQARIVKKSVACIRCSAPLYYPATLNRRKSRLCCARCGAQTPIPSTLTQLLKLACVVFFLVAAVLIALALRRHS